MLHSVVQQPQAKCSPLGKASATNFEPIKPTEQTKKRLPAFWRTLKRPSANSLPPELPIDPLKALTDQQRATYDHVFNTLNSPDFELPPPSSSNHLNESVNPNLNSDQLEKLSLRLTQLEMCYCTRECLLRVCRATGWDSKRALKRLVDTLVWRREFQVDQIDYQQIRELAEPGIEFLIGYDNMQRPLLYMFPSKQADKPSSNQLKLLVWYLERTIDLMPPGVESLTLMIDFASFEKSPHDTPGPISTAKEVIKILQTYYCERLGQAICVNVPWRYCGSFKVLKPFLDPQTTRKILFDPVVTDYVPAEQLLKEGFGGDLDFQYDCDAYIPLLAQLTAHRRQRMLTRYQRLGKGMVGMSELELRGGVHQSQNRREVSSGSETATMSTLTTRPGSPSVVTLRSQRALKTGPISSRSPPRKSRLSSPSFHHRPSDLTLDSRSSRATSHSTLDSRSPRAKRVVDPRGTLLTTNRNHPFVASRPYSLHSVLSPLVLPSMQGKKPRKKLCQKINEKTRIWSSRNQVQTHPPSQSRSFRSSSSPLALPTKEDDNAREGLGQTRDQKESQSLNRTQVPIDSQPPPSSSSMAASTSSTTAIQENQILMMTIVINVVLVCTLFL